MPRLGLNGFTGLSRPRNLLNDVAIFFVNLIFPFFVSAPYLLHRSPPFQRGGKLARSRFGLEVGHAFLKGEHRHLSSRGDSR